jgi:myo-inositol-1-phosphate synthase
MGTVKVAIVGVGNCAASLVQGVHYSGMPTRRRPCRG